MDPAVTESLSVDPVIVEKGLSVGTGVLMAIVILIIGWTVGKWVRNSVQKALEKAKVDTALARFLASITRYLVLAAAVIAALGKVGVETTSLVAVLASAGLAIGLALQGSLANFASGVMILFFRPFDIGNYIEGAGAEGTVKDIGLFATTILTLDEHTIIVPNAAITGGNIINYSTAGRRRGNLDVGVCYGSDLKQVERVLLEAMKGVPLVLQDPPPALAFVEMGGSSLNFKLRCWAHPEEWVPMTHQALSAAYDALNAAGIEIPFPQVVVHRAPDAG